MDLCVALQVNLRQAKTALGEERSAVKALRTELRGDALLHKPRVLRSKRIDFFWIPCLSWGETGPVSSLTGYVGDYEDPAMMVEGSNCLHEQRHFRYIDTDSRGCCRRLLQ